MKIQEKLVEDVINDNMLSYSSYVLTQRALPDLRDGLKPVARRILYSMRLNGVTKLTKSATVTGKIFELHPHGDTYSSVVNLVQKDRQNIPLLEGKGSWGQYTSNKHVAAASRYTEVKLGIPALEIMKELKDNPVNMIPNYDGTIDMPEVLPVTYPLILTNASSGIGVGFASSTISYNIHDLRQVVANILDKKTILFKDLIPDFTTGGVIMNTEKNNSELENIFKNGSGSFTMRAKAEIKDNKIIVYELPYGVRREQIIDRIIKLAKEKKLNEVSDVRDGTSFTGMKIVITLKNNVDAKLALEKLFLLTPMQANVSANMNILDEGYPKVMGTEQVLNKWIVWRKQVIKNTLLNKLDNYEKELHLLLALKKILIDIDKAIEIIRFSEDSEIFNNLMKEFDIDQIQAEYISNIKLRNINKNNIEKQISKIENLEDKVKTLSNNIEDDKYINTVLLERMDQTIKNIGDKPRRTHFEDVKENTAEVIELAAAKIKEEENYDVVAVVTENGYVFKNKASNDVNRDVEKLKGLILGDDKIERVYELTNEESIFAVLENFEIGQVKMKDLDDNNGVYIQTYLEAGAFIKSFSNKPGHILFIFDDGQAVKIEKDSYITNRKVLKNGYYKKANIILVEDLEEGSEAIQIELNNGKKSIQLSSDEVSIKKHRISSGSNQLKPRNNGKITCKKV